jgi:hypothetical protein
VREQIEALNFAIANYMDAVSAIIAKLDVLQAEAEYATELAKLVEMVKAQTAVLMERAA